MSQSVMQVVSGAAFHSLSQPRGRMRGEGGGGGDPRGALLRPVEVMFLGQAMADCPPAAVI